MKLMLAVIFFLVLLRLFERAMERSRTAFDPFERYDSRPHRNRKGDR